MENNNLIDPNLAMKIINSINQINKILKSCGNKIDDKTLNNVNILFNMITETSEKIMLHSNIIDSVLLLVCKTLELVIQTTVVLIDTDELIRVIYTILKLNQVENSLQSRWKLVDAIFNYFVMFINAVDKFNGEINFENVFKVLMTIFDKMDEIKKFSIMPGFISKLIKFISFSDISKQTGSILLIIKVVEVYLMIVLDKISNKNIDKVTFENFFEFYFAVFLIIKDKKIKNTALNKSLKYLLNKFVSSENDALINKPTFCEKVRAKIFNIYLHLEIETNENEEDKYYLSILKYTELNTLKNDLNNLLEDIQKVLNKHENHKIDFLIKSLHSYFNLITFANFENTKIISEKLIQVIFDTLTIKENFFLDVVNIYEVQIKSINEIEAKNKISNIILKLFNRDNINYSDFIKFLSIIPSKISQHFPEFVLSKLMKSTKSLKNLFIDFQNEDEEENATVYVKTKEINKSIFMIINDLLVLYVLNNSLKLNQKQANLFKNNLNFLVSFLSDYRENLEALGMNKLSLLNSFILTAFALIYDDSYSIQERNSILTLAMINYSNKTAIQKYSSILVLNKLSSFKNSHNNSENDVKSFLTKNFDFIISSMLKKILYFKITNEGRNTIAISNFKLDILNFFNSLILFLEEINDKELLYHYTGEFLKFLKKLFSFIELYIKEKNYLTLDCLLEIILKITNLISKVIEEIHSTYKPNESKEYSEENEFAEYLKTKINISDSNILRNLLLRINPLILCNKAPIAMKVIRVFNSLLGPLYYLPITREENVNFSAEDRANVIIKSSLGSVLHESWGYMLYILTNVNLFKQVISLFAEVTKYYPRFFNESRLSQDLLPNMIKGLHELQKSYSRNQLIPFYAVSSSLINAIVSKNFVEDKKPMSSQLVIKLLSFYDEIEVSIEDVGLKPILNYLKEIFAKSEYIEMQNNEKIINKYLK
jgi:hypothetical protein